MTFSHTKKMQATAQLPHHSKSDFHRQQNRFICCRKPITISYDLQQNREGTQRCGSVFPAFLLFDQINIQKVISRGNATSGVFRREFDWK
jgi:hypothetical protein